MNAPLRCKLGDLALVIKGKNSGKIVTCAVGPFQSHPGERITFHLEGQKYICQVLAHEGWCWAVTCASDLVDARGRTARIGMMPDAWLLPLRPPAPEDAEPRVKEQPRETA